MSDLARLLPIEAMRPGRCPTCGAVAPINGPPLLHGHGTREREAVLPGQDRARLVTVMVRRFQCTACEATCTVRPEGVLAGLAYTLLAIVNAWRLASRRPVGEGLDDAAVYAHQGVDRLSPEGGRGGATRWRSLARWADQIGVWWPARAVAGSTWRQRVGSLLAGFIAEGDLTERALASHAACGAAM